jgi:hypothetical protein
MMAAYSPTTPINFLVTTSDEPTLREAMKASTQEQALLSQAIEEEFDALDCCYALLRMRPLSIPYAECSVVIPCGKVDYDKSG